MNMCFYLSIELISFFAKLFKVTPFSLGMPPLYRPKHRLTLDVMALADRTLQSVDSSDDSSCFTDYSDLSERVFEYCARRLWISSKTDSFRFTGFGKGRGNIHVISEAGLSDDDLRHEGLRNEVVPPSTLQIRGPDQYRILCASDNLETARQWSARFERLVSRTVSKDIKAQYEYDENMTRLADEEASRKRREEMDRLFPKPSLYELTTTCASEQPFYGKSP